MKPEFLKNGVRLRWLNIAGFELIIANGKHILLHPNLKLFVGDLSTDPLCET